MKTVSELRLTRWNKTVPPASPVLHHVLQTEGLTFLEWTDPPGTIYPVHTHPLIQVHVILSGQMRIGLPETNEEIILNPGDRLDLPPDTPHWEDVVGTEATTYLAANGANHNHAELDYGSVQASGHGK